MIWPGVNVPAGYFDDFGRGLIDAGFNAVVDGDLIQLAEPPALKKSYKHDIAVVVDRLVAAPDILGRITDSVETALGLAGGIDRVEPSVAPRLDFPAQPVQRPQRRPRDVADKDVR